MDWYLIGRILGAIAWPLAAGAAIYVIGWLLAATRKEEAAARFMTGTRLLAAIAFFATAFITMRELLRYVA